MLGTEGKISEKYGWIEEEYYYNWDESHPPSKDDLALMEYVRIDPVMFVETILLDRVEQRRLQQGYQAYSQTG